MQAMFPVMGEDDDRVIRRNTSTRHARPETRGRFYRPQLQPLCKFVNGRAHDPRRLCDVGTRIGQIDETPREESMTFLERLLGSDSWPEDLGARNAF